MRNRCPVGVSNYQRTTQGRVGEHRFQIARADSLLYRNDPNQVVCEEELLVLLCHQLHRTDHPVDLTGTSHN